jgi:hypothetical protein
MGQSQSRRHFISLNVIVIVFLFKKKKTKQTCYYKTYHATNPFGMAVEHSPDIILLTIVQHNS